MPIILLGIRSTVKDHLKESPAELVYGQNLNLSADLTQGISFNDNYDCSDFAAKLKSSMNILQIKVAKQVKIDFPSDLNIVFVLVKWFL